MGKSARQIIDSAARWRGDLISLGSHGHKGMQRLLLGNVTEFPVRHADCSVPVVRLPASQGRIEGEYLSLPLELR